jgi:uncharacterized membrane protein
MESDSADTNPGDEPLGAKREHRLDTFKAHSETRSIALNAPVTDVYEHCCRFEQLPQFIESLVDIKKIDDTNFWLTISHSSGQETIRLQIVLRVPERRIAWQANCTEFSQGVIVFEPLTQNRTEITLKLRSAIEPEVLSRAARDYLVKFKQFVEQKTVL